ncbi:hypothetical protein ACAG26_07735 [Mycobacterium sp. pUA109]|uniref:hypothetical protein n=1 Tax=Mycobacterium sp. pUA109 TaxID=3238982 RepID=UPI00351B2BD6
MSGSAWPPEGFRWVEQDGAAMPGEEPRSTVGAGSGAIVGGDERGVARRTHKRRWWSAGAAAVLVVVLAAGGLAIWRSHQGGAHLPAAPIGTPQDLLVGFPLGRQPIPSWKVTPDDIGLPPDVMVGDLFASSGTKAYFVTSCRSSCADPISWVYGLDTATGARLFAPVPLPGLYSAYGANCYNNGPSVGLCVTAGGDQRSVWVIDLDRGAVTFTGPTDLLYQGVPGAGPILAAVGDYRGASRLVAAVKGKGVYGIGPHAELTWFVPGGGTLNTGDRLQVGDIPPLTIAVQFPAEDHSGHTQTYRVFSVVDGTDLTPAPPPGTTLHEAVVYNGGFAYQYVGDKSSGVTFYDTNGRLVATEHTSDPAELAFPMANTGMPTVLAESQYDVYTANGKVIAKIPAHEMSTDFKTIGTKIYVRQSGESAVPTSWQQWDLLTGEPGAICQLDLGFGYVASDGEVILVRTHEDEPTIQAINTSDCHTLWETPARASVWKVGTGLIQRNYPGDSIVGLRPPS